MLCGGPGEVEESLEFEQYFTGDFLNLVGKTNLVDLMYVIKGSSVMLANETSGPHFAAALAVKSIYVISNGNHFGRFTPYPPAVYDKYHVIFPEEIESQIDNYQGLAATFGFGSKLDIQKISPESVIDRIENTLTV